MYSVVVSKHDYTHSYNCIKDETMYTNSARLLILTIWDRFCHCNSLCLNASGLTNIQAALLYCNPMYVDKNSPFISFF